MRISELLTEKCGLFPYKWPQPETFKALACTFFLCYCLHTYSYIKNFAAYNCFYICASFLAFYLFLYFWFLEKNPVTYLRLNKLFKIFIYRFINSNDVKFAEIAYTLILEASRVKCVRQKNKHFQILFSHIFCNPQS